MADNPSRTPGKTGKPSHSTLEPATKADLPRAVISPDIKHVVLEPPGSGESTPDEALWGAIRDRTTAMNFRNYELFIERVFCRDDATAEETLRVKERGIAPKAAAVSARADLHRCYHGPEAYNLLRAATEVFLALNCGVKIGDPRDEDLRGRLEEYLGATTSKALPYLDRILNQLRLNDPDLQTKTPLCEGLLRPIIGAPDPCYPCMLELIWWYWHEEAMLVQSLNAICLRFQNKRGPHAYDPLANLRLDPLRPLNTLLWGFIQDEINRLTVARRAYEYDHEYGLRLLGKAVADIHTVDSRSKFLEAFHNLLHVTGRFYKEADDTTVRADAFPVLNALRELHLILAQGAHNQFGDLPWTARVEMLIQKWLLARSEIREFLGGAPMVPYKETWMAHADAMKTLQGWSDVTVSHYRDLGVYGEQILLSVRWGDWIDDGITQSNAYNWALEWRPEIQSYIHSYRAVTGVDLSSELTDTRSAAERYVQPSIHQLRRLGQQGVQRNGRMAARNGQHETYPM